MRKLRSIIRRWLQPTDSSNPTVSTLVKTPLRVLLKRKTRSKGISTYRLTGTGKSAADSDEFRRRILIPFDLSARLFSAPGGRAVSLPLKYRYQTHATRSKRGFPSRKREKREENLKYRKRRVEPSTLTDALKHHDVHACSEHVADE